MIQSTESFYLRSAVSYSDAMMCQGMCVEGIYGNWDMSRVCLILYSPCGSKANVEGFYRTEVAKYGMIVHASSDRMASFHTVLPHSME